MCMNRERISEEENECVLEARIIGWKNPKFVVHVKNNCLAFSYHRAMIVELTLFYGFSSLDPELPLCEEKSLPLTLGWAAGFAWFCPSPIAAPSAMHTIAEIYASGGELEGQQKEESLKEYWCAHRCIGFETEWTPLLWSLSFKAKWGLPLLPVLHILFGLQSRDRSNLVQCQRSILHGRQQECDLTDSLTP